jgi:hypothetical protein
LGISNAVPLSEIVDRCYRFLMRVMPAKVETSTLNSCMREVPPITTEDSTPFLIPGIHTPVCDTQISSAVIQRVLVLVIHQRITLLQPKDFTVKVDDPLTAILHNRTSQMPRR